ncbi:MAG: hypothetical protein Roseis2KO_21400 [Roseivirga sp.]
MLQTIVKKEYFRNTNSRPISIIMLIWFSVYVLAIFQDFLFSQLRYTGFYLSESMLYNTWWILFIPFLLLLKWLDPKIQPQTLFTKTLYRLGAGIVLSGIHLLLFTTFFVSVSELLFSPPHRFSTILRSALSNHAYLTLIIYVLVPLLFKYIYPEVQTNSSSSQYQPTITVKTHSGRSIINVDSIQCIRAERPYTAIHTADAKLLHDQSLKSLEKAFDPDIFLRVHRSVIVNKQHISTLKSRNNGDFDALLSSGESVRFSRHYRKNWGNLV